jgi:hypothetical protein
MKTFVPTELDFSTLVVVVVVVVDGVAAVQLAPPPFAALAWALNLARSEW